MTMKLLPLLGIVFMALSADAARPVARWDVVPYQRVSGVFTAGVCAFHEDGVKVEFSVDGKKMETAMNPVFNKRTRVWEYVFNFDTAKFPDGPVTLGAKAITLGATPEVYELPPLSLFANANGSLSTPAAVWADSENGDDTFEGTEKRPVKTLQKAMALVPVGGTVYLKKGHYSADHLGGKIRKYWTTVSAAPGVKRDDCEVKGGRVVADKIRFKGLSIYCEHEGKYGSILAGENGRTCCWVDDSKMWNKKGRYACNSSPFGNRMVAYVTGGETTQMGNGPGCTLQRGHSVYDITSDVWTGSNCLVVNCKSWNVNPGKTSAHPDFYQSHAPQGSFVHDVILYNVSGWDCVCQGLFGVRLRDSAFVNVSFHLSPTSGFLSQFSDELINVLFAHVTIINQSWLWRGATEGKQDFTPTDVRVINSIFSSMGGKSSEKITKGLKVDHNAFYGFDKRGKSSGVYGTNAVRFDRPWANDASGDDFPLPKSSPAYKNGIPLQCVPADYHGRLYPKGDRPCGAFATSSSK